MQDGFEQIPRQDVPMKSLARGVPAMGFLRGLYSNISCEGFPAEGFLRVYVPTFPAKGFLETDRGGWTLGLGEYQSTPLRRHFEISTGCKFWMFILHVMREGFEPNFQTGG